MSLRGTLIGLLLVAMCLGTAVAGSALARADGADPAINMWPHWPGRVSCGGLSFKPLVAFAGPTGAERGTDPSEIALREFLAGGELSSLGVRSHGWRLLAETARLAEFANGRLGHRLEVMTFEHRKAEWKWDGWSEGCTPQVVRHGRRAITWTLAAGQRLTTATRTIKVHLGPGECASGRSQNERLEHPSFRTENGALLMALWLRPVRGAQTCEALIEPPVTIHLPHRLGRLRLLDGSVFPPEPPVEHEG